MSQVFILAATLGLLFLAPSAGLSAYSLAGHRRGPGEFQEEGSKRERKTRVGQAGNRAGDRLSQAEVLLAKAQTTSKKKG